MKRKCKVCKKEFEHAMFTVCPQCIDDDSKARSLALLASIDVHLADTPTDSDEAVKAWNEALRQALNDANNQ